MLRLSLRCRQFLSFRIFACLSLVPASRILRHKCDPHCHCPHVSASSGYTMFDALALCRLACTASCCCLTQTTSCRHGFACFGHAPNRLQSLTSHLPSRCDKISPSCGDLEASVIHTQLVFFACSFLWWPWEVVFLCFWGLCVFSLPRVRWMRKFPCLTVSTF